MKVSEALRRIVLAFGISILLVFVFAPPLYTFQTWSRAPETESLLIEVRRGASVLQQTVDPGAEVSDKLHGVIRWRLLFPLLGYWLKLPAWAVLGMAHAGALAVLLFLASVLRDRGLSWSATGHAMVLLGAASWFFTATGWLGYYDSWLAFGLLIVAFGRRASMAWLASLLTPWVDERFVIALPLAMLGRYLLRIEEGPPGIDRREFLHYYGLPVILILLFIGIRLGLLPAEGNAGLRGYLATQDNQNAPIYVIVWGIWEGLRLGWIFAGVAVGVAWRGGFAAHWGR